MSKRLSVLTATDDGGMGVLSDGSAYLSQKLLARLCDISETEMEDIKAEWDAKQQTDRVSQIKESMRHHTHSTPTLYLRVKYNGDEIICYPSESCTSVLEYYAFSEKRKIALRNFKNLIKKGLIKLNNYMDAK